MQHYANIWASHPDVKGKWLVCEQDVFAALLMNNSYNKTVPCKWRQWMIIVSSIVIVIE